MSGLQQIDEDLSPEAAALARALRDLFTGLKVSTRRYAARRSYDSSTVSRYLSGRRLPPWKFVLDLLHDVAEERGTVPTAETIGMLRELHTAALRAGGSPVHQVQLLQRKLADADQEARRAALRERALEENLQDREHRIRDLQTRYRELQAAAVPSPPEQPGEGADEHARLRAEIQELQRELEHVRALHRAAEERCAHLERQLMEAEQTAERVESTALVPQARDRGPYAGETGGGIGAAGVTIESVRGDVHLNTGAWQLDEEYVEALTVQVLDEDDQPRGYGLVVGADTVVTMGYVVGHDDKPDRPLTEIKVSSGERRLRARLVEVREAAVLGQWQHSVAALRLSGSLPFPGRPLEFGRRQTPGSQLLVSGFVAEGRCSYLLEVTGRRGDWLRVSGEADMNMRGAPVFSGAGGLAGLVASWDRDRHRGHILPATALLALNSIDLNG